MNENHETADATGAPQRATLILMGLAFIGAMAAPFFCGGTEGCRLGVLTLWSAFGWPARAGIAMLVAAGIWMILRVLGLRTLASIVSVSSGSSVRRSTTSTDQPRSATASAASVATGTMAP